MRARTAILAVTLLVLVLAVSSLVAPHVAKPAPVPTVEEDLGADASRPPIPTPEELYTAMGGGVTDGTSFGRSTTLSITAAPDLVLPTGRLVAADAMMLDAPPFTTEVEPGRHPVTVLEASFDNGDRRVAAAMVRVRGGEPVDWRLALVEGQDPAALGPDEFYGYGVDSGTGSFTSPEAVELLANGEYDAYGDDVLDGMFPGGDTIVNVVTVEVDPASGANVVAMASGFGDGAYATFVGFDADGRPVAFITDFGILDGEP